MEDSNDERSPILDTGRPATRTIRSQSTAVHALKYVGNGVKGLLGIQGDTPEGEKVLLHEEEDIVMYTNDPV